MQSGVSFVTLGAEPILGQRLSSESKFLACAELLGITSWHYLARVWPVLAPPSAASWSLLAHIQNGVAIFALWCEAIFFGSDIGLFRRGAAWGVTGIVDNQFLF